MQGHNAEQKVILSLESNFQLSEAYGVKGQSLGLCLNTGFTDIWAHLEIQSVQL